MKLEAKLKGFFHWQLLNADGSIALEGKQSNLILDSGLDAFALVSDAGFTSFRDYLAIGTNGTLPNIAQTTLLAEVQSRSLSDGGFTSEAVNTYTAIPGSNVFRAECTVVKTIVLNANRNIAEFGLCSANAGGLMSIREVPRDGGGTPIVIAGLTGQIFKLNHTLRVDLPYNPVSANFTITNSGVQSGTASWFHDPIAAQGVVEDLFRIAAPSAGFMLKPITNASSTASNANPTYVFADAVNANGTPIAYVNGTYSRVKRVVIAPSAMVGNHGGWAVIYGQISNTRNAGYKFIRSSGNYVKSNLSQLTLDFAISWARGP
jgi:hypothetical protein